MLLVLYMVVCVVWGGDIMVKRVVCKVCYYGVECWYYV